MSQMCRITCLISSGVHLEDMSVHLPGLGSSTVVHKDLLDSSRDLKRLTNLVKVEILPEKRPVAIWPFVKSSPPTPEPKIQLESSVTRAEYDLLVSKLSDVGTDVKALLQNGVPVQSISGSSPVPTFHESSPDPIFIPSKIVPEIPAPVVKTNESDIKKSDMDSSIDALRKIRRR